LTQHDENLRLRHMLDHGREALTLIQGVHRRSFEGNRVLQLAIVHLLAIVGEAAARTPDPLKREHTEIPWRDISDLRNRLIHGYDTVDLEIVWTVLTVDLPELVSQLGAILDESKDS